MQSLAPYATGRRSCELPDGRSASILATVLAAVPALMTLLLVQSYSPQTVLMAGLSVFGVLFAINSSLHSYLVVSYAAEDGVSLDVGFYYMANALGRLLGTVLSGWLYQRFGLAACLVASAALVALAAAVSVALPRHSAGTRAIEHGHSGTR